jgi:hypothetical protein
MKIPNTPAITAATITTDIPHEGCRELISQVCAKSFHEKAGTCQDGFSFSCQRFFRLSRAASVAILPSALFVSEHFSLGASWASFFQ